MVKLPTGLLQLEDRWDADVAEFLSPELLPNGQLAHVMLPGMKHLTAQPVLPSNSRV
jgi:hypothetical protein